jgi:hypothetical protein
MSNSITNAEIRTFKKAIELQAQQMKSKLRMGVRNEMLESDDHYITFLNKIATHEVTTANADTTNDDITMTVREIDLRRFVSAPLMDSFDAFKIIKNADPEFVKSVIAAMNRTADALIYNAFDDVALSGKGGATSVSYTSAMTVGSSAAPSAAGVEPLLHGKTNIEANDMEGTYHVVVPVALKHKILMDDKVANFDYNTRKALFYGEIDEYAGLKFHWYTGVEARGTAYKCFVWEESSMAFGIGKDYFNVKVEERADKNYSTQIFTEGFIGATRLREEGVSAVWLA